MFKKAIIITSVQVNNNNFDYGNIIKVIIKAQYNKNNEMEIEI